MLQLDHVLCLVSPPVASSVALRQAAHLVGGSEGEGLLHVVSQGRADPAAFAEAVREQIGRFGETTALETHVLSASGTGPDAARRAIQRVASDVATNLLVLDPPADRDAVPPSAADQTQVLVDELDCPLFVVEKAGAPAGVERILVPTDLSDESIHTLRHATELADGYDASVVLLHVIDKSPYIALTPVDRLSLGSTTLTEHRARRRLQQFLEEGRPPDVPIHTGLAFGNPADRIAHVVTERVVDLLVLGSHGEGAGPPLGPVADRVLRRVTCSTMLVRAGDRSLLPARSNADAARDADRDL